MIEAEELKHRQEFEARMAIDYPLISTAWDTDYNSYVYDEVEDMFRGWMMAHEVVKEGSACT